MVTLIFSKSNIFYLFRGKATDHSWAQAGTWCSKHTIIPCNRPTSHLAGVCVWVSGCQEGCVVCVLSAQLSMRFPTSFNHRQPLVSMQHTITHRDTEMESE
ncbi:hypothetical protein ElyMa_001145000 [Elysia marginata]|uniref:Uncharacterized protein n=1 Tax=Elysia marginata TaxID=1093978 RepID=A0AAV4I188_9GAST|nr:hypothetical protein ElyMa_001145000 [Elysia marginata]